MQQIIQDLYKPRAVVIIEAVEDGKYIDDLEDNITSNEFTSFFQVLIELNLHMVLNEPPIYLQLVPWETRSKQSTILTKYEFQMFTKSDFYCIDGFPTEGMPGVVVLPTPLRDGYVY